MTRPIKFRAWDKALKKFVYLIIDENGIRIEGADKNVLVKWVRGKRFSDWQQITGLLDKNGKEIYEGDIVEVKVVGKDYQRVEVKWRKENLGFWHSALAYEKEVEVIGNIYENKDLLK